MAARLQLYVTTTTGRCALDVALGDASVRVELDARGVVASATCAYDGGAAGAGVLAVATTQPVRLRVLAVRSVAAGLDVYDLPLLLPHGAPDAVASLAFSPCGRLLGVVAADGRVHVLWCAPASSAAVAGACVLAASGASSISWLHAAAAAPSSSSSPPPRLLLAVTHTDGSTTVWRESPPEQPLAFALVGSAATAAASGGTCCWLRRTVSHDRAHWGWGQPVGDAVASAGSFASSVVPPPRSALGGSGGASPPAGEEGRASPAAATATTATTATAAAAAVSAPSLVPPLTPLAALLREGCLARQPPTASHPAVARATAGCHTHHLVTAHISAATLVSPPQAPRPDGEVGAQLLELRLVSVAPAPVDHDPTSRDVSLSTAAVVSVDVAALLRQASLPAAASALDGAAVHRRHERLWRQVTRCSLVSAASEERVRIAGRSTPTLPAPATTTVTWASAAGVRDDDAGGMQGGGGSSGSGGGDHPLALFRAVAGGAQPPVSSSPLATASGRQAGQPMVRRDDAGDGDDEEDWEAVGQRSTGASPLLLAPPASVTRPRRASLLTRLRLRHRQSVSARHLLRGAGDDEHDEGGGSGAGGAADATFDGDVALAQWGRSESSAQSQRLGAAAAAGAAATRAKRLRTRCASALATAAAVDGMHGALTPLCAPSVAGACDVFPRLGVHSGNRGTCAHLVSALPPASGRVVLDVSVGDDNDGGGRGGGHYQLTLKVDWGLARVAVLDWSRQHGTEEPSVPAASCSSSRSRDQSSSDALPTHHPDYLAACLAAGRLGTASAIISHLAVAVSRATAWRRAVAAERDARCEAPAVSASVGGEAATAAGGSVLRRALVEGHFAVDGGGSAPAATSPVAASSGGGNSDVDALLDAYAELDCFNGAPLHVAVPPLPLHMMLAGVHAAPAAMRDGGGSSISIDSGSGARTEGAAEGSPPPLRLLRAWLAAHPYTANVQPSRAQLLLLGAEGEADEEAYPPRLTAAALTSLLDDLPGCSVSGVGGRGDTLRLLGVLKAFTALWRGGVGGGGGTHSTRCCRRRYD